MSELKLDVDQASELKAAFRRGNWTNAEIKKICEGNVLEQFREVILGHAEIVQIKYVIDCDADPFCPNDWKVNKHKKGGQLEWDLAKTLLYLSDVQKKGGIIEGDELRKEIENMPVLNANVLVYLLAHQQLVPEEWKNKAVFFWGTIYCDSSDGKLYVSVLRWSGYAWVPSFFWLGGVFNCSCPAALLAS